MKRIAFHHFGCKVNFSEASTLTRQFRDHGYEIAGPKDQADIYVISSCAVTREAEKKCIYAIRHARRLNPDAKIAVIGCFPELNPEELKQIEGVSLVLGQTEKFRLLELVDEDQKEETLHYHAGDFIPSWSAGDRTRSFLKIQDGCDYFCSYCTIPFARGHSRSDTIGHILEEAKEIAGSGIREIILTGVNIGDFGRLTGERLDDLLAALESQVDIPRIRISSIEPDLLSDEIIERVAKSDKLLPHFHIPLQSGSDAILKSMHRKYDTALYAGRVARIREMMPHACIAADVITGFPGEGDREFEQTIRFIESVDISYLHVFSYSLRERTLAAKMENPLHPAVIKARSEQLHELSDRKKKHFYESNAGRKVRVLFESDNHEGYMHGFSENYLKVRTPFISGLINTIQEVVLGTPDEHYQFTHHQQ